MRKDNHGQNTLTTSIQLVIFGVGAIGMLPNMAFANTKQDSLNKLAKYYQTNPDNTARCHGAWVQPQSKLNATSTDNANTVSPVDTSDGTVFAQADLGYWDNEDYAELSGDVIVEQSGRQVRAEKVTFKPSTGEITADGQVLFADTHADPTNDKGGLIGVADKLAYTDKDTAIASDVAFASTDINAHGHAKQMTKEGNHYQMQEVMFSTCPPNERKWHLDADSIDIDTDTGRGIAKNTTFNVGNTPVFYLPYFNFPIDDRRSTGFLLPNAGFSSDRIEVSTPYYVNLAPNYDLTLTPTIYSNTNPMLTGEFRYLTQKIGSGTLMGSYLPNDNNYNNQDRSRLFYDHEWHSKKYPNLSIHGTYRRVSDLDYLSDFDTLGLENNPLNLPRRIQANYYNDHVHADLRVEAFQSLGGTKSDGTPITDKDKPYSRLPQLSVHYTVPTHHHAIDITGVHNTAYFKKSITDGSEAEKSGVRMYNQINLSRPITKSWGYVTPQLGLTHLYTSYDEDSLAGQNLSKAEGRYSVFAPTVSVDSGLFFEKQGSPFGLFKDNLGGYQTLSPRLKYTYTPYKSQNNIPNFDTDIASISYDQLLSDSWMLGYDRIQDLHAITPAMSYRYMDKHGLTRIDAGIAEQFLIDKPKVGIDDSQTSVGSRSGVAWQVSTQPKHNLWVDFAGALTPDYHLNSSVAQVRYQPNDQSLFNVGVVERKENKATNQLAMSAYTASAIFPINNRWRILSQAQYDHKNDRVLDMLLGVNYEDCCYGLSVYARQYRNDLNPESSKNHAIMAEIRLNGITSGGKLNRLLSDKVMGYDHAQHAWQRTY